MDGARRARLLQIVALSAAATVGGAAVLPYAFTLGRDRLDPVLAQSGWTLGTLALLSSLQTAVLAVLAVTVGLWSAKRIGWGAPVIEALSHGERPSRAALGALGTAFLLGLAAGALCVAADALVFVPELPELAALDRQLLSRLPLSYGALACLYGAIDEEIFFRLFAMSVLALLLRTVFARSPRALMWAANLIATLLFALGHLPALRGILPATPLVMARTLLLNGVVGVFAGWLFARRGLEAAMAVHGGADVVLHVLAPLLLSLGILRLP
jgi:membrane protease YdiL (CAAX protease family)